MSVSFNNIPQGLRVPLFYAEMDNSMANSANTSLRTLLIGQTNDDATHADIGKLVLVSRTEQAALIGGAGSQLHAMHRAYRNNDAFGEVWALPIKMSTGTAAAGGITFTGTATVGGVVNVYIAGQRVQVPVVATDTAAMVATAAVAAINAVTTLPVKAAAGTAGAVTLTAKFKGLSGNDVTIQLNRLGTAGGETMPLGITATITAMTNGAGAPDLATALAALGDEPFEFIAHPFTDTASLDALAAWMNDTAGRWSWIKQIYGHVYSAKRGDLGSLVTFGKARNDQHATVHGFEPLVPQPAWEVAAAWTARTAVFIGADPARPTQTGVLTGIDPAPAGSRWMKSERQSLLTSGLATGYYEGGYRIDRGITTYQRNAYGAEDDSYLDSETLHTSAYVLRYVFGIITSKYGRHKLANDGTRYGPGQAIVTPAVIRGELTAAYRELEYRGIVENAELFKQHLIVERNSANPNRLDVLFPPDYINQLRIFALLNQFRLQYSSLAE